MREMYADGPKFWQLLPDELKVPGRQIISPETPEGSDFWIAAGMSSRGKIKEKSIRIATNKIYLIMNNGSPSRSWTEPVILISYLGYVK